MTDTTGKVTDSYQYNAYGEITNKTGNTDNNYLYAGEQFDRSLNQYYLRARYYNQGVGRFTQQDTWQGRANSPITLNKYLYADANPVMNIDPTGRFTLAGIMAGINARSNLGTLNVTTARMALERFLVGNVTRSTGTTVANSNGSLGLIGNLIREEMKEAVGTKAHTALEERVKKLNETLNQKFNMTKRWGVEIKSEAFFDRGTGNPAKRRELGSFGVDVTISRGNVVLSSFDLKTGGAWTKKESKFRASQIGSDIFQIFVIPKK